MSAALSIKADPVNGADSKKVCQDACLLAHKLGVLVEFNLNGVELVAGIWSKGEDLHAEYVKANQ